MLKYYLLLNVITFLIYGIDKYKAIKKRERISEAALLFLSAFAPLGAIVGMIIFRHKTKKIKFKILITIYLIINAFLLTKILLYS